jgi:hypothetical protein
MSVPHPNSTAAAGTSGVGVAVVWLLGHFGVQVSNELAVVIAGALTTAVLFVGRVGIAGTVQRLLHGSTPPQA